MAKASSDGSTGRHTARTLPPTLAEELFMWFSFVSNQMRSRLSTAFFVVGVLATVLAGAGDVKWG